MSQSILKTHQKLSVLLDLLRHWYPNYFCHITAIISRWKALGICAEGFRIRADFPDEVSDRKDIQSWLILHTEFKTTTSWPLTHTWNTLTQTQLTNIVQWRWNIDRYTARFQFDNSNAKNYRRVLNFTNYFSRLFCSICDFFLKSHIEQIKMQIKKHHNFTGELPIFIYKKVTLSNL